MRKCKEISNILIELILMARDYASRPTSYRAATNKQPSEAKDVDWKSIGSYMLEKMLGSS